MTRPYGCERASKRALKHKTDIVPPFPLHPITRVTTPFRHPQVSRPWRECRSAHGSESCPRPEQKWCQGFPLKKNDPKAWNWVKKWKDSEWLSFPWYDIWLVVTTYPSEKSWSEKQLGLWHSQYMENHKTCSKPPTRLLCLDESWRQQPGLPTSAQELRSRTLRSPWVFPCRFNGKSWVNDGSK